MIHLTSRQQLSIRHFKNEKWIGAEMRPAMNSGIVAADAPVSYWPIGSLHDLITWSTFGKHENNSFLNNFSRTNWESILELGNL